MLKKRVIDIAHKPRRKDCMMNKVRWGLLSTANINRHLIPAIRASKRGELHAVASRTEEKAQTYADQWQIPHAFGNYEAMLDSGAVDAVYISLPNHLHAEWTIRALEAGLHVLCEKPFALSEQDVDRMIAASERTGKFLAEAFMYRHHPQTKAVGDLVGTGRLGEITIVRAVFNFLLERRVDIRLVPEFGGGALWDIGVYPVSFAQYIFGSPPMKVFGAQRVGETGVDESFCGTMIYAEDKMAQISCSFRSPFHIHAEICGSKGRLVLNRPFVGLETDRRMLFIDGDGNEDEIPVPEKALYLGEIEDLHAVVLDGAQPYLTLQESKNHVRTVCALYQSAQTNNPVDL
jgi:xylose dehydrogenase (NAD/NADP)